MTDPRWHKDEGWEKRTWRDPVTDIEIHYVVQKIGQAILAVDDFKFKFPLKNQPPSSD